MAATLLLGACGDGDSDSDSDSGAGDTESTIELRDSGRGSDGRTATTDRSSGSLSQDRVESSISEEADDEMDEEEGGALTQSAIEDSVSGEAEAAAPSASQEPARIDRPDGRQSRDEVRDRDEPDNTTFVDAGVNPFVDTADDPQSTFALDVDTASYTLGRSWINQGVAPDAASVRVEEWVNFFDQDYDSPRNDTFAVYADGAPHPFVDDDTYLVRIGISSREVSERQRDPINLTLVVDTSGSMGQDNRMELVHESIRLLSEQLDRGDTVAIVGYGDRARLLLEPTAGDDHRAIDDAIDQLRPDGSTNAEAGLTLGYDLADEMWQRDHTNRVVLLSDGVANVGATGPESILARIGDYVRRDIHLVSVGVGFGTFNDHLLEQLANQGDGWYAYVDSAEEAERIFVEDLVSSFQVVAEDAKVQVEFDARNVESYRLLGFENRDIADEDFRNDRVDAGEIGAGHTVTALYEVELARGVRPGDGEEIATVYLRWQDPDARGADEVAGSLTTDVLHDRLRDASAHYRLTASAATFAEILRGSRYVRGVELHEVLEVAEEAAFDIGTEQAWELVGLIDEADRFL